MRIILHIDLDAFYASVEELRNPSLKGKPLVICMFSGREDSGAVATANYSARKLGIRSGMPLSLTRSKSTPETTFLPADRAHYRKVSGRVMELFRSRADRFEQRSIDEAYLDASSRRTWERAAALAMEIKSSLLSGEGITCSIGIGPNKLTAKMASREQKPDGLTLVREGEFSECFWRKPAGKLFGIGPRTLEVLAKHDVQTIQDLAALPEAELVREFGQRKGLLLSTHANGIDDEPVSEVVKQQLSRLSTLPENTRDQEKILRKLSTLADELHGEVGKEGVLFRTVSIILISARLETRTRSRTLPAPSSRKEDILSAAASLLKAYLSENPGNLRRVGVGVSSFSRGNGGLSRFL